MSWQKINLPVPKDLSPSQRVALADLVIEHIVDRTQHGKDKNGDKFPKYSKDYIRSLDFKNAGKSANKVDLQLSGDMLAALSVLSQSNGSIRIGFENGTPENNKAEGNILGSYGGEPNSKRARDFLGIEQAKYKELINYVRVNGG